MGARKGRSKSPGKRNSSPKSTPRKDTDEAVAVSKGDKKKKVSKENLPAKNRKPIKKKEIVEESSESENESRQSSDDSSEEPPKKLKTIVHGDSDSEDDGSSENNDSDSENEDSDSDESDNAKKKKGKLFSDENAKWLKPKKTAKLLSSDDESDDSNEGGLEDDSESEDDEMEVEKQSRLLDARKQEEDEEAEEEFRETVSKHTAIYHLPTKEELELDVDRVVPPSELKSHINSILEVLAEFKERREPGRARSEYIDQLGLFIAELYGYLPELVAYFLTMFSPAETLEFIDYSDKPRPMVIRTNTLKTRRKDLALALMKRGVTLDPLASWSKVGLKIIESTVPIGATPEYLSGHYMLQSAASMCPVLALSPQPNERVLDMSAAPGGKTSYIAQLMRNTGVVFANDLRPDRQKATVANMHRLGVKNVITCCYDGRKLPKLFQHYKFDRILLDAPCSGLGVISRDPSCKVQRTITDVNKTAHLQKELLLAAIDTLNHKSKSSGGVMVYSTCSVSVAENEEVVNYALQKRDIKIIDTGLDFGRPGFTRYQQKRFHPSVALTRRFYPHVHNLDGFYVCKIQKLSDKIPGQKKEIEGSEPSAKTEEVDEASKAKKEARQDSGKKRQEVNKQKRGKKRKGTRDDSNISKKKKAEKVSLPPKQQKQKSKKLNAKMTKPRRRKAD
eukprot:CAMPEP_0117062722 /NCGR_PEP_ID=MMETSP0472-20121206/43723_1 /TAXON_ID=693140 ORGANISM="Tiarina fusus, Strain LIS" /NCGR_SAMPLE_ID=MMETSP0472 /ASSEMBLY_ACC=CAM_ASM_000603 /LENGTH=676 /DNA_ID=CAMNT_0004782017 /DNA_START=64 /DNA_END=2094 /DNA_ORIENTATION=-